MAYTNSPLVSYTKLSPNHSGQRTHSIDRITPHCVVGQCSVETLGSVFAPTSRQASCQYGIGVDGRVGMYVEEKNRSWCSSSNANDQRAVTIECASDTTEPYAFKDIVYQTLIKLCIDICQRNGKSKLLWLGDKDKTLSYSPKSDEMVLTVHRWFANKSCPGNWLYSRMDDLAAKVTAGLGGASVSTQPEEPTPTTETIHVGDHVKVIGSKYYTGKPIPGWVKNKTWIVHAVAGNRIVINKSTDGKCAIMSPVNAADLRVVKTTKEDTANATTPYVVQVSVQDLNIRKGPGTNYGTTGRYTGKGCFTIVEEASGTGSTKGWGKLKSGIGWISLDYATKI